MKTHHQLAAARRFTPGELTITLRCSTSAIQVRCAAREAQYGASDGQSWVGATKRPRVVTVTPTATLWCRYAMAPTRSDKRTALTQMKVAGLHSLVKPSLGPRSDAPLGTMDAQRRPGAVVHIDAGGHPPRLRLPIGCASAERFGIDRARVRKAVIAPHAHERGEITPESVACDRKASVELGSISLAASALAPAPAALVIESQKAALAAGRVSGGDGLAGRDQPTVAMCDRRAGTEAAREAVRMLNRAIACLTGKSFIDYSVRQFRRMPCMAFQGIERLFSFSGSG